MSKLLAFEFLQADGLSPIRSLASAVDTAVEAPGLPLNFARTFPEAISQRYELDPLGYGWSDNWELSLVTETDGTVEIVGPAGSRRTFHAYRPFGSSTPSYYADPGDYGKLTATGGGVFALTEADGLLYVFRADGTLNYVEDPNRNRVTAGYTGDLLTSLSHSSGETLQIAYNAPGRIQSVTDEIGRQTVFTYDAANEHLLSVQDYDGQITTYTYNNQSVTTRHALASITYPGGTHRYFTYDSEGRLAGTYPDSGAEMITFGYGSAGTVSATDATGGTSTFFFDKSGLLLKTEDALGNVVRLSYDYWNNLTAVTDPAGRSYTYRYDGKGNLISSTDPLGDTTRFSYIGPFNRLASVTDANGNLTKYTYDGFGNLQAIRYADGSTERWTYDELGNRTPGRIAGGTRLITPTMTTAA